MRLGALILSYWRMAYRHGYPFALHLLSKNRAAYREREREVSKGMCSLGSDTSYPGFIVEGISQGELLLYP